MAAALGSILKKGAGTQSVYKTAQYERLNQDPSDNEEEEDDILFIQDGTSPHNGFLKPKYVKRKGQPLLKHETVANGDTENGGINGDIKDLELQKARIRPASEVEVRVMKLGTLTKTRILCFIFTLLLALSFAVALIVLLPRPHKVTVTPGNFHQTANWTVILAEHGTETCVRLFDVDEDGRLDVLYSFVPKEHMGHNIASRNASKAFCKKLGKSYPCVGVMKALRGHDGAELWQFNTLSSIFEINCGNIDVNHDGKADCVASGRLSAIAAFDPRNGTVFWSGDTSVLVETWNNYNIAPVDDMTGDGVKEIVLAHGGDPSFPPQVHTRYAGRLILLDGATGMSLGRYLEMPESKETYMSPVLHQRKDGSQYILFGHGGETVAGSLFAISVPDFYRYVIQSDKDMPQFVGAYQDWPSQPQSDLVEIYRSLQKGMMVPPVCVDVNKDGVKDILVVAFDGTVILYDGETLDMLWTQTFPGMESYSTPAPGYFDDDDVLDFMFHMNIGDWPMYAGSMVVIVDGKAGTTLWSLNSTLFETTSDLVVRTTEPYRDLFLFRVKGRVETGQANPTKKVVKRSYRDPYDPYQYIPPAQQRKSKPASYGIPRRKLGSLHPGTQPYSDGQGDSRTNQEDFFENGRQGYAGSYDNPLNAAAAPQRYGDVEENPYETDLGGGGSRYGTLGDYRYGALRTRTKYPGYGSLDPGGRLRNMPGVYGGRLRGDGDPEAGLEPYYTDDVGENEYKDVISDAEHDNDNYVGDHHDDVDERHDDEDHDDDGDGHHDDGDHDDDGDGHHDDNKARHDESDLPGCQENPLAYRTEVFVVDRSTASAPLRLKEILPKLNNFAFTEQERAALQPSDPGKTKKRVRRHGGHDAPDPEQSDWSGKACYIETLTERSTSALGDVDGDGSLDLVLVGDGMADVRDAVSQAHIRQKPITTVYKINLETEIHTKTDYVTVAAYVAPEVTSSTSGLSPLSEVRIRPYREQPWTAYLGKGSDSVYENSKS